MADASQLQLNPYALFDPSQWADPFSNYQKTALPQASYAGWPTDAMGNPIQAPQGMTINQTPAQPAAPAPAAQNNQDVYNQVMQSLAQRGMFNTPDLSGSGSHGPSNMSWQRPPGSPVPMQPQQTSQPAAAPAVNNAGLTPQQYMALRANPGPIPTYGANVPQANPSSAPGTGVLQQFLSNWKPASSGPGSGFQQGFAAALKNKGY